MRVHLTICEHDTGSVLHGQRFPWHTGRDAIAIWLIALFCVCFLPVQAGSPAARVANEYDLKAAFIFNLAKFIQWPAGEFAQVDAPLVIGVVGDDALERFTQTLKDRAIDKHKLVVRRVEQAKELPECHILFISRSGERQVSELIEASKNAKLLTAGETDKFLELGGMILFTLESDEVRLQINDRRIRSAGLNITASALSTLVNKGIAKIREF
jgi:hypothetical protein